MLRSLRQTIFLFAFFCTACILADAQAVSGNLAGTVQDSTGAAIPNAAVTVTDLDRGTVYQVQAGNDGNYSQTHLLAGHYKVQVQSQGFGSFTADVLVQVDTTTRVDATLQPAGVQTQVSVTDIAPLLTTDRAEIATTLTGAQVQQLPVLDRNVTTLLLLVPGTQLNSWQHAASENPEAGIQANVNGQFFTANGFLLDGTENESAILGIAVINPNVDSLQDFKVSTSNYEAEFGSASGALIQATTRAGTNQFHGSLFEFLRNSETNAADPFTQLNPPLRWNQFGGSLGAPILKDKLFGFFDYEGTRRRTGGSVLTTVPTAAERNGDLSALLGSYICADGSVSGGPCPSPALVRTTEGAFVPARAGMVFDPSTGNSSTGEGREVYARNGVVNVVPVAAPMATLLNYIPLPNTGTDVFNNYVSEGGQRFDTDQYDGRVDYNLSGTTHIFGRYTLANYNNYSPAAFGDAGGGPSAFQFSGDSVDRNQSLSVGLDHTFSPTLITDARFGFFRYRIRVQPNDVGTTPAADAGIPGLNTGSVETSGMPAFYVQGSGGFNFGYALGVNQCNCPLKETENHFQWVNNWTKITGNHTIKFGGDIRRAQQQRIPSDSHRSGEITFADSTTGNATLDQLAAGLASTGSGIASYLLGLPSNFSRYYTGSNYYPGLRQTRLFFYAQDTWRVTPRLTFTYGLRWEDYLPQVAAKPGGAGSFDPTTGDVLAAGIGSVPRNLGVKPYNLGFVPRIGFAYQATPKTVLRAGYGESFNPGGLGAVFGQGADYNPPIVNPQVVPSANPYSPAFNLLNGPPAPISPPVSSSGRYPLPNGIGINYYTYPLDSYRIPQAYFWNATLQQQLPGSIALEAAYVGNVGRHLFLALNENQAIPGPGDYNPRRPFYQLYGLTQGIYQYCNCDNSNYNSLQTKLQKQFSHGLDFLFTYTWSKALGDSEGAGGFSNNYNVRASYGPMSWDRTHQVTLEYNWDVPVGRDRYWKLGNSTVADVVLGGWRLSGTNTFGSGLPFTPTVSNAPLLNTDFNNVRADLVGNPSVSNQSASMWFNPAAYTEPQQLYRNGTAGRNSLRGPALYVSNFSLSKNFIPSERWSVELRGEAFNVFNHVNLGLPNSTIDTSGAGQITYVQAAMRQMQFGLHLRF
ncbi:MAG TPA: TonB-dependent receptor [Bryobacteraceae bacterium]|jgi:hypothetical protein|nr:TonB-dependent receptor [Bryobacteraceae bacterium]